MRSFGIGQILIGTCSWTDPTLVQSGRFYPPWARTAEARLKFYSSRFPVVEVDSTYYGMPAEKSSGLWVNRTSTDFIFDIKAFRLFTQHPTQAVALPKDIRDQLPAEITARRNFYSRDVPKELLDEVWRRFADALLPLDSAGKLGVVLFQFPSWFNAGKQERDYIASCKERLPQYRMAVEFRNASWVSEKNCDNTMEFLRSNDLAYVCVDEPQGFNSSVPPVAEATSDIAVIRFHGRNSDMWEKAGDSASNRFNYFYSQDELKWWVPQVNLLASKTNQLHVLFNNCYSDKAIVNAGQMALLLGHLGHAKEVMMPANDQSTLPFKFFP